MFHCTASLLRGSRVSADRKRCAHDPYPFFECKLPSHSLNCAELEVLYRGCCRITGYTEVIPSWPQSRASSTIEVVDNPISREPRDGRCVGPSFRVRNDMADLSKNRVCCGHAAGHFVGSQGASRTIGPAGAAMGFSSTCPAPRIFHRWPGVWRNGQTYLRHAESRTNWKNEGICHHKMATKRDSTG